MRTKRYVIPDSVIKDAGKTCLSWDDADDLVWAAGLISLSKEIGYEITLKEADKEKEKAVSTCGTI